MTKDLRLGDGAVGSFIGIRWACVAIRKAACAAQDPFTMTRTSSTPNDATRRETQPLLALLHARARLRGHSQNELARKIGVSYRRLAQWQSGEASLKSAQPGVLHAVAQYLDMPRAGVLAYVGLLTLDDFEQPAPLARDVFLHQEIERMRLDPVVGPFVPSAMSDMSYEVQAFILFLYRETGRGAPLEKAVWFNQLHTAVVATTAPS